MEKLEMERWMSEYEFLPFSKIAYLITEDPRWDKLTEKEKFVIIIRFMGILRIAE